MGETYIDRRTNRRCTFLGGRIPMRWADGFDQERPVECSEHNAQFFRHAEVEWEDGEKGLIGADYLFALISDPEDLDPPPFGFLTYEQMTNLPDPAWLVEGVVQEQTAALLFGKSNSFKSFLAIDLLCSVATGTPWHGNEVKGPAPCLYVATEGARGVGKQRIPGWMQAHGIPPELRNNVFMYPQEIALDDDNAVSDLLKTAGHQRALRLLSQGERVGNPDDPAGAFAFVVIDIFGSSMMGPETSDETAREWVRNINRIMREMGCAVLTVAHTGWADETRARMHTHFWGSFDSRMKADGDKDSLTTVLKIDRHKDANSDGEWGFRMEKVQTPTGGTTLVPRLSEDVETKRKPRLSGKPKIAMQALSGALIEQGKKMTGPHFPSCPVVSIDTWRTMCDRHGLTDSDNVQTKGRTFRRVRDELHQKGEVRIFDEYAWRASNE